MRTFAASTACNVINNSEEKSRFERCERVGNVM